MEIKTLILHVTNSMTMLTLSILMLIEIDGEVESP
jgi:hypothetical protein